jgi:6-phosphogluconolactonase (cycloisomerase 2 family)
MGWKFRWLAGALLSAATLCCLSCSNTTTGTAVTTPEDLYVTTAGDATLQGYVITPSSGALTLVGQGIASGLQPTAMVITPALDTLFVASVGGLCPGTTTTSSCLGSFTINADGSTSAASTTTIPLGENPVAMAINAAGTYLFVANQGTFSDPTSGTISVFAISGTTATEISGSPFQDLATPGVPNNSGIGPSGLAISASDNYLYVSNNFNNTVSAFTISSSGALTQFASLPYLAGTNPTGLTITPSGSFLFAANSGSNNVSAFAICDKVTNTCSNAGAPDGTLTEVTGEPFAAGLGPSVPLVDPSGNFLYVVDKVSNQVSQYRISSQTGVLAPISPAAVSTGPTPVALVIRVGSTVITSTGGQTEYLYVANNGGTSLSTFSFDSTVGQLTVLGGTTTTDGGNPSALTAR